MKRLTSTRGSWRRLSWLLMLWIALAVAPAVGQSVHTDADIETSGQLVSTVQTGTAPLDVDSTTRVSNLNVDLLDGFTAFDFAFFDELATAMAALDKPDPPCFSATLRFVDCGNGTVTDTATGLIWLKKADCFSTQGYVAANNSAAGLSTGACGLTDGSRDGDWRLPTKSEWEALHAPACSTRPKIVGNATNGGCYSDSPWATGVSTTVTANYWSSQTYTLSTPQACMTSLAVPSTFWFTKSQSARVWPVRDGR